MKYRRQLPSRVRYNADKRIREGGRTLIKSSPFIYSCPLFSSIIESSPETDAVPKPNRKIGLWDYKWIPYTTDASTGHSQRVNAQKFPDQNLEAIFSTRRYNASITFRVERLAASRPAKFIAARFGRARARYPREAFLACWEGQAAAGTRRRLPPFAIIYNDAFTCPASGAKPKREVRCRG